MTELGSRGRFGDGTTKASSTCAYQGRFKSFRVQEDEHFLTVCRYVERNALRANLVERAEDWRWSSLYRWSQGTSAAQRILSPWPIRRSPGWLEHVNAPETEAELSALRRSVLQGSPFGDEAWSDTATQTLGLEITTRPRGRPRKNGPDTVLTRFAPFSLAFLLAGFNLMGHGPGCPGVDP